jgi:integrase
MPIPDLAPDSGSDWSLAPADPADPAGALAALVARAREFASCARSRNTLRAYAADWRDFETWCRSRNFDALPASPQTVALYLTALAQTRKVATLTRRISAISQAHRTVRLSPPTEEAPVRLVMAGIRRTLGTAAQAKRPILIPDLQAMVGAIPDTLIGKRDRAILLIGFTGAFRRSELAALDCEDLAETPDGLVITIRRSKTDQEAEGRKMAIPRGREDRTCPVRALAEWRAAGAVQSGPVFLRVNRHGQVLRERISAEAVAIVVKRYASKLGYDISEFAGHSLRAGLATAAAMAGKSERAIMNQTGHRSTTTVRRYIRDGNLFRENAAEGLGL